MRWPGIAAAALLIMAISPPVGAEEPTADDIAMVADISPGWPLEVAVFGDRILFWADDSNSGFEPWVTDGTAEGTRLLRDINPGPRDGRRSPVDPSRGGVAEFGDQVLFAADDGVHGEELWVTDGTTEGTRLVKDINPGAMHGSPGEFTVFAGEVLFIADDGVHGGELWVTDGTTEGTRLVKDTFGAGYDLFHSRLTVLGDQVLFTAGYGVGERELWATDGTPAGTRRLMSLPLLDPTGSVVLVDQMLFGADDGSNGHELWTTDGTADGTRLLRDINPGPGRSGPRLYGSLGSRVLFTADDGVGGAELWVTDGSTAGTRLVKDINPGPASSNWAGYAVLGDQLLFAARDGAHGNELWVTDGTTAGTRLLRDINPGISDAYPWGMGPYGNRVLFQANNGVTGSELWVTDGTTSGTRLLRDINPGTDSSGPEGFAEIGDKVVFAADDGVRGSELWSVAPGSTVRVNDQVTRLYQAAFGRAPDPTGFDYWGNHYRNGAFLTDLARSFVSSPEFSDLYGTSPTNAEVIDGFYLNILGRTGDPNGRAYFINLLDTGRPRAEILVTFSESPENVHHTNTTPPPLTWAQARIIRLYAAAFGRTPDMAGAAYWTDTHRNGTSLTDIAAQFRTSPEFTQRYGPGITNEAYLQLLYNNVLGRAPDPAGLAFWLAQLDTTLTRDQVLVAFSESPENIERTNTTP